MTTMTEALPRDNRVALHSTQQVLTHARTNKLSTIAHLTEEDVANIWFGVSQFIAAALTGGKGVHISGLGTFSLSMVDRRTPVFQLSQSFLQLYKLTAPRNPSSSNCPVLSLNFTKIARAVDRNRDDVEACFHEIMNAIGQQIRDPKPRGIAILFFGIGKLSVRAGKVKFAFFQPFLDNPHTIDATAADSGTFQERPSTVGVVEHLDSLSRAQGTPSRLGTARYLVTPTIASLQFTEDDFTPSRIATAASRSGVNTPSYNHTMWKLDDADADADGTATSNNSRQGNDARPEGNPALAPSLRPKKTQRLPLSWQSSLVSDGMVSIVDGPHTQQLSEEELAEVAREAQAAQRRVKQKRDEAPSVELVDGGEVDQFELLSTRNLQSTVFIPLVTEKSEDGSDSAANTQTRPRNVVPLPGEAIPTEHRLDRFKEHHESKKNKKLASYEEWQRLREQSGNKTPARHRLEIRDQLQQDASIKKVREEQEKEEESFIRTINQLKADKAEALRIQLEQRKKAEAERVAQFNERQVQQKQSSTLRDIEKQPDDGVRGADVFVFRPSTSKDEIARYNQEHKLDILAQSAERKAIELQDMQRKAEEGKRTLESLQRAEEQAQVLAEERKAKAVEDYRDSLKKQIDYKKRVEEEVRKVHPRQPVPFDLKHLVGADLNQQRVNSAVGRPAAALGPEMYKQHDLLERRMKENALRVYERQVELQALRNRKKLLEREDEAKQDKEILHRVIDTLKEDEQHEKEVATTRRKDLQDYWVGQKELKEQKDSDEVEDRKKAAPVPIKDQMDYLAYLNGFG